VYYGGYRMKYQCHPEWVSVNNEIHHVSDFAHLKPRERPPATCPVCKETAILKLGQIKVHHFAHKAGSVCALTNPETALHYNMKCYIHNQLKTANTIWVEQRCNHYNPFCQIKRLVPWLTGWDDVQLEYTIGGYRPDIALLREGQVIGAIEVLVTHAVETEKAEFYNRRFIRWVEIQGSEPFYQGDTKWSPEQALTIHRIGNEIPNWLCDSCRAAYQKAMAEAEAQAEFERTDRIVTHAAMVVDFYHPSGKHTRQVYFAKAKMQEGIWRLAYVVTDSNSQIIAMVRGNPLGESNLLELTHKVYDYLETRKPVFTDIVESWFKLDDSENLNRHKFDPPTRYVWNKQEQSWNLKSF
jgi:hypothetical protein